MELEAEESWLRKRIMRLRTLLRYANDPRIEVGLREVIADAEHRLEMLQDRARPVQQQQQIPPKKRNGRIIVPRRPVGVSARAMASGRASSVSDRSA
jgi:hypothetical protein